MSVNQIYTPDSTRGRKKNKNHFENVLDVALSLLASSSFFFVDVVATPNRSLPNAPAGVSNTLNGSC